MSLLKTERRLAGLGRRELVGSTRNVRTLDFFKVPKSEKAEVPGDC